MSKEISGRRLAVSDSSGNVFEDLGRPDAEEQKLKARLAAAINRAIESRGLRQAEAAVALGATQPDISALANYKLSGFSVGRLVTYLLCLKKDLEIAIRPSGSEHGHVSVRELETV
jgi:predicted XRE-type DNA-binding protein